MTVNANYKYEKESTMLYKEFFENNLRILIYSGNADAVVATEYSEFCIADLVQRNNLKI